MSGSCHKQDKWGGVFLIANCKRCDRLFQKNSRDICPDCIREQLDLVAIIKAYLKTHKHATVSEVSRETDIPVDDIVDLIEDHILILVDYPNIQLTCERCGTLTQEGRFCAECRADLISDLANMTKMVKNLKVTNKTDPPKGYFSR